MKMSKITIATSVTQMSPEEIKREILSSPSENRLYALLNESLGKGYMEMFYIASDNPRAINNPQILSLIIKAMSVNSKHASLPAIMDNICEHAETLSDSNLSIIKSLGLSNPDVASTLLLHRNTHDSIIENIVGHLNLNVVFKSNLENSPFLRAIIKDLKSGTVWSNSHSALLIMPRIVQVPQDLFITEISTGNFSPNVATILLNASELYKGVNPRLANNIKNSASAGVNLAKYLKGPAWESVTAESAITVLLRSLNELPDTEHAEFIWNLLKERLVDSEWLSEAFTLTYLGTTYLGIKNNILLLLMKKLPHIVGELITFIKNAPITDAIKQSEAYEDLIGIGINNPSFRPQVLQLPEEYFRMIRMTDENAKIVEDHFRPKNKTRPLAQPSDPEELEELRGLLSKNGNWYNKYSSANSLNKEAGLQSNILSGILAAIMMVLGGATIYGAAKKNNVKEEDLKRALQNKELVNKVQERIPTQINLFTESPKEESSVPKSTDIDVIVKTIMQHEGLIPKQTPFRITNPTMRNWNKIHGFPIDKTYPKPKGRENFIFLANANDVPKAIKKQLQNYVNNPSRYGLSSSPSLKDALKVFDQSGVKGKLNYMQKTLPELDVNKPLSDFFA
jgi:hypothetical protein